MNKVFYNKQLVNVPNDVDDPFYVANILPAETEGEFVIVEKKDRLE